MIRRVALFILLVCPSSAWATAYTTSQAGKWSVQATWGGSGPPTANDTVTVTKALEVDASVSCGLTAFTTGGTASVTFGSGGSMTIDSGVTLTLSGDVKHTADSTITMNAGSTLSFKTPSGQQAVWSFSPGGGNNYNAYLVANGTSGSHCTVKTDTSLGGTNTICSLSANRNQGILTCTYTDFSNFGTSSNAGLVTYMDYNNNGNCSITNCTFTGCSYVFSNPGGNTWDGNLTFQYNIFSSSVGSTQGGTANACASFNSATNRTSGTRLIDTCSFDLVLGNGGLKQFIFSNCYLAKGMVCLSGSWPSASYFSQNLLPGCTVYGSVQNCFFYNTTASNPHTLSMSPSNTSVTGCVFDTVSTVGNGDMVFPPTGGTFSVTNCIVVPNSSGGGVTSGKLISNLETSGTAVTAEHNTYCATGATDNNAGVCALGETGGAEYAGCIASCRANLIWTPSAGTNYAFACDDATGGGSYCNSVTLAGYNAFWNGNTGTCYYGAPTGGSTGGTTQSGVTGYNGLRISNAGSLPNSQIGTGDLVLNPQFVDSTRNLATWGGTTAGGGTATAAAALATIAAHPSLIAQPGTGLLAWVRRGYVPRNLKLRAASYGGDASTTDAQGNAWPGGVPGIGAMGWANYTPQ